VAGPAGQATGNNPTGAGVAEPGTVSPAPLADANHGSGCGLTRRDQGSKLEGLPRRVAERRLVGVRPLLENSTACQKSMPNLSSFRGVARVSALRGGCSGCSRVRFLWLRWMTLYECIRTAMIPGLPVVGGSGSSQMSALPGSGPSGFGCGVVLVINGEFDPGSGRTLAACLTHASRTVNPFGGDQWRTGE
jgi:hypothetical protein